MVRCAYLRIIVVCPPLRISGERIERTVRMTDWDYSEVEENEGRRHNRFLLF